jgi:hypothetical protein
MEGLADGVAAASLPASGQPVAAAPQLPGGPAEPPADAEVAAGTDAKPKPESRPESSPAAVPSLNAPPAMQAELPPRAPTTDGGLAPLIDSVPPMTLAEPPSAFQDPAQAPLLPVVELRDAGQLMMKAAAAHAASTALREAARTLVPEIDLPPEELRDLNAAHMGGVLGATEPPPARAAPTLAIVRPAEPVVPPTLPQPPGGDPLAALRAMSDDELIALFS